MARYSFQIPSLTPNDFALLSRRCEEVVTAIGCKLAGWDGTGEPVFSSSEITFNGIKDESHDTFSITLAGDNNCVVETNDHAYDLAVRCCLIIFRRELGSAMTLTSNIPEETLDWVQAEVLVDAGDVAV